LSVAVGRFHEKSAMRLSAISSRDGAAYFFATFLRATTRPAQSMSISTSSSSNRKATFIRSWIMNGSQSNLGKLGRSCESAFRKALLLLVGIYRTVGTPLMGGSCRFEPSCSEYAIDALNEHTPSRATWMIIRRLGRCRPLGPHGFDPVPPKVIGKSFLEKHST
jgi:uncharacterized protein